MRSGTLAAAVWLVILAIGQSAPARAALDFETTFPGTGIEAQGLPPSTLAERPDWAIKRVSLDGKIVWVVAVLPTSVQAWSERVLLGTQQAEAVLLAVTDQAVRARAAADPVDYRERQALAVRFRLRNHLDREGFLKVETLERPRAVWMRFGYPAEKLELALGFTVPGSLEVAYPERHPKPRTERPKGPPLTVLDYAWEASWVAGVVTVAVIAVLFAQATQK